MLSQNRLPARHALPLGLTRLACISHNKSRRERHILITILIATALLTASFAFPELSAKAQSTNTQLTYDCSNHCYGVTSWSGPNHGAYSLIDVVQLHAGDGIMNNSLWVANGDSQQWIEAGYAVIYNQNHEFWYWAYIDDSGTYHEYDSSGLNSRSNGDFGFPANVYIWKIIGTTNQWNAAVYGHVTSWLPNGFTMNNLSPSLIEIGQELSGTSGGGATTAHWTRNEWISSTYDNYHFQTLDGNGVVPFSPPSASWVTLPSQSSTGGDFIASTP